ncbi:ABC transporter ATP-binding protein [Alloalcanivorax gelatiniphagus]
MTHTADATERARGADLVVSDIKLAFGGIQALDGPSFTVPAGQICGLIGPNGAGKTTLFNCVSRLYTPDSGSITFGGTDILVRRPHEIAALGIARTFQNVGLFPTQTAAENVMSGAYVDRRAGITRTVLRLRATKKDEDEIQARAHRVLARLGLDRVAHRQVAYLPFGLQKKVELARTLMSNPRLVLLDEPANGLTQGEVMDLAETIRHVRDEEGFSVLLVEHHLAMVKAISDHLVVLNFGRKIAEGTPDEVTSNADVVSAYLGGAV